VSAGPKILLLAIGIAGLGPARALAEDGFVLPHAAWITFRDCPVCSEMVVLPSGLAIGRTPVTKAQFAAFARETGFRQAGWGCVWTDAEFKQGEDHPAVCVSWTDATAYAAWLARKTGKPYRLPTVEELRSAAMAGETGPYWWGQSIGANRANCNGCGSRWDNLGTAPVGSFKPNPYGVFDAVGNVWQWTSTCHAEGCGDRVLVGGAWSSSPAQLRVATVIWNEPDYRLNSYGFRVVRDAE
jgi:formylglycine-generating enzyme required for sulfatase activity